MLASGKLSVKILCPEMNVAVNVPVLVTGNVQVQLEPSVVLPLTLFCFATVRSGKLMFVVTVFVFTGLKLLPETVPWFETELPEVNGLATVTWNLIVTLLPAGKVGIGPTDTVSPDSIGMLAGFAPSRDPS